MNVPRVTDYVRGHPFFEGLKEAQLHDLTRMAALQKLDEEQILGLEGDRCTSVYFVVEGRIRAIKMSAGGRKQVLGEFEPGEAFYMVPALDDGPLPVTTRTATRATLLRFSRQDFLGLVERHPPLAMQVLNTLAQRMRRLTSLVEDLSLRSVSERLAKMLLERAESARTQRITQREMAAQLGTVREVVARNLSQFQEQGWIEVHRGSIEIIDPQALRREAAI
ncbi:MAG: Crp/Fnr family transcriptional regulator [Anaerolineae bacterium]